MNSPRLNKPSVGLSLDRLVAHRGYRGYPANNSENTIGALRAALENGAQFVEFDVQLTAEGVPVVFHDEHLQRMTGDHRRIMEVALHDLPSIPGAGSQIKEGIPTVNEVAAFLRDWPSALAFVEIKPASIEHFGVELVVKNTLNALPSIISQCIIISYDLEALYLARSLGACAVGWVLKSWCDESKESAEQLHPEYLFVDHLRVPPTTKCLWAGPWQWVMYEIDSFELAHSALSPRRGPPRNHAPRSIVGTAAAPRTGEAQCVMLTIWSSSAEESTARVWLRPPRRRGIPFW